MTSKHLIYLLLHFIRIFNNVCRWIHSEDFYVIKHREQKINEDNRRSMIINIDTNDEESIYLTGHVINEKNLFPATGYLYFIWRMIASLKNQEYINLPIVFEDVNFIRAVVLTKQNITELTFIIQKGNIII